MSRSVLVLYRKSCWKVSRVDPLVQNRERIETCSERSTPVSKAGYQVETHEMLGGSLAHCGLYPLVIHHRGFRRNERVCRPMNEQKLAPVRGEGGEVCFGRVVLLGVLEELRPKRCARRRVH